ncbi:NADH-dependent flavin oxidoreductase [Paenibacillus baekrokdamisoli]|uniref:NADH-dependent flavin oxidoreductase n=1 Tax=Paenibacillus baekrokdamisoli TaxID=1712516 RepID=A0A3G9IMZ7_9BACL|nr:NADH-dependent flavin oxidoreductase [Paenibacillus baekrokdamisoli]MBB3073233.1 2,4-dienoyl-CoA reductase-like NADH-dependent reductase (Old Yellow Enzyme family) [Paenibacillus baekrokdamisoli]BBH20220.1 NADH-dependent flavin oxidoreductase [Paenibacillus baekrokdamisoli]
MNSKYNQLFQPFTFKNGITIKNRVVMAPMTTWASNDDLTISDEEVSYYRKRVNGVGLVITGCTQVTPNGQGFTNEFAAYDDSFIPSLRKLADAAKSGGAPALLQIFHAGNKALPDLDIVSPSAMKTEATAFAPSVETRELSHGEILSIIHAFGETTRRAIEAGFDGIEIHGAHGFLIQNFWSPITNQRTDEWGGTLENRLRFPTALIEEIKSVIKKHAQKPLIIGFRISPEESREGGLRMKDTYELIERLVQLDVDYIHASLDDVSSKPIDSEDDKTRLELILDKVNGRVPVMAAGSVKTPDDALKAVEKGLPLFAIGHALVMDPEWAQKALNGREAEIDTELKVSKLSQLELPDKLWNVIQAIPGWFTISKEEEQVK